MPVFGPLLEMTRIQSEINKLFDHLADLKRSEAGAAEGWTPNVDVFETAGEWIARFELPGVDPDGVHLTVDGNQLILSGEKARPEPDPAARFHCVEREFGRFRRQIPIGSPVNPKGARAEFRDGLLEVVFPKVENRRGGELRIPVGERGGGT
ncbi:MAG: Hsp20/alpha crystallin family protein [Acidobacteria bacterium]|nr:Hsp20/alpha crystallin family protein [Acidobacteriota bacterium]